MPRRHRDRSGPGSQFRPEHSGGMSGERIRTPERDLARDAARRGVVRRVQIEPDAEVASQDDEQTEAA
jgi:hypothetical protein